MPKPQRPSIEQPDRRRNPDERRPAHRQHGQQRRQHAEHHRRGQAGDGESDADQYSLQQGRHGGAERRWRESRRSIAGTAAPCALRRGESGGARGRIMASPSRRKKNSRNSMIANAEQRAQGAQKKAAAETGRALQHLARAGDQPGLHLLRRDARVRLQPGVDAGDPGKLLQIRKRLDVELRRGFLQLLQQRRKSAPRTRPTARSRATRMMIGASTVSTPAGTRLGRDKRRRSAKIQRIQQKREKRRPAMGTMKRRENQHQRITQERPPPTSAKTRG